MLSFDLMLLPQPFGMCTSWGLLASGSSLAIKWRQESWEIEESSAGLRGLGTLTDRLIMSYLKGSESTLLKPVICINRSATS